MQPRKYYKTVQNQLKNCFANSDCAIAIEKELIKEGYSKDFPKMITIKENLDYLTQNRAFQVHLPIIGEGNQTVLCPMDFEIFLSGNQYKLYADKETQRGYFKETVPVINFIKKIFTDANVPFMLDFTPSGGHILFNVDVDSDAGKALQQIGCLEEGMLDSGLRHGVTQKAMLTFSGITRIAEYVALKTLEAFKNDERDGKLPVTVSDSAENCINIDNSWCEGAPHARSIRSPFSLHKKNIEKYKMYNEPPLVDVVGGVFDGRTFHHEADIDNVIECMWDLQKASDWSQNFDGVIPFADNALVGFIEGYKKTALYKFHREFDSTEDLPFGKALEQARQVTIIPDWSKDILYNPDPRVLQPINMMGFIYDFVIFAKWKPKHVANIMRDIYLDSSFNWAQDFVDSSPADEKANFWTRTFAAIAYWKTGALQIN